MNLKERKIRFRVLPALLLLFSLLLCGSAAAEAPAADAAKKNGDIVILYTGDVHCGVDQGFGYAGVQQIRDYLIAEGNDVILVDNGDSTRGEPIGTVTKGEAITDLMNKLGYGVAIPGNHEFDYGMDTFLALAEKADFPYISCNFNYKGEPVFEPYVIRELAGKKVAFVGVTTPKTITSSTPAYFRDENGEFVYGFCQDETGEGVYGAVQAAADAARAEGAEYVVVMAHLGNEANCMPWTYADVISHTAGIDVLLDGHSHDTDQVVMKNAEGKDVPRSACGTRLEAVGWCRIGADGSVTTGLYTWNNQEPAPRLLGIDNDMSRAVAQAEEQFRETLNEVVAGTTAALTVNDPTAADQNGKPIRIVRRMETNLGDLCADAYRVQSGADIAFVNGGGIRVSIQAGDITYGNILSVFPFGNSMCVIEATGQQILDALEWGSRAVPNETGAFLQVSGLTYEIHSYIPSSCVSDLNGLFVRVDGERRVKNVRVGGQPIDPEKTYTLASHDYMLLNHGDGCTVFDGAPLLQDRVKLDNQLLIDYIVDTLGGVIGEEYDDPYGQDRIRIVEQADEIRLRVFETSDIHGCLVDTSSGDESTFQYRLACIAQIVNDARASGEYDDVILLDGGDIYQGTPVSNLTGGAAMLAAFDAMGYDAAALGNHEFDWGVTEYCAEADGTLPAYHLGSFEGNPDIPVLASNLFYAGTGERVNFTRDYAIVEKAGLRVALIGYIDDYSEAIMARMIAPYRIDGDPAALAARVKEINEAEKPDVTILLCHAKPLDVAEAMSPEEVDLVAGGHKHNGIFGTAGSGVPYIQGDSGAKGYASATVVIAPDGTVSVRDLMYTAVTGDKTALYDVPENADALDDTVLAVSHAAWEAVSDEMSEVLGYIDTPILKKGFIDERTTGGGNWITGMMLRAAKPYGAAAAFFNRNGVRASLQIPEGEERRAVRVGDIYTISPFNNIWQVYELSGAELARHLVNTFANTDYGDQVSGLTYTYINRGSEKEPDIEIVGITLDDGTGVDPRDDRTLYRICTCDYCATLEGSVFLGKEPLIPEGEAPVDNLAIIEMLREDARNGSEQIPVDTAPRAVRLNTEGSQADPSGQ